MKNKRTKQKYPEIHDQLPPQTSDSKISVLMEMEIQMW